MSEDKIYNKVITIQTKEETKTTNGNTMVKLTDHTGEKFSFFKKKKDGELSSPAVQFRDMGLDEGGTTRIGYVIETYEDKNGVTRESHKIINFQETSDEPSQASAQIKVSDNGTNTASHGESKNAFSRRLAVQGHINALLSNQMILGSMDSVRATDIRGIVLLAIVVEDEAEKQINRIVPTVAQVNDQHYEVKQTGNPDEVDVDDIPF